MLLWDGSGISVKVSETDMILAWAVLLLSFILSVIVTGWFM